VWGNGTIGGSKTSSQMMMDRALSNQMKKKGGGRRTYLKLRTSTSGKNPGTRGGRVSGVRRCGCPWKIE